MSRAGRIAFLRAASWLAQLAWAAMAFFSWTASRRHSDAEVVVLLVLLAWVGISCLVYRPHASAVRC